MMHFKRIEMAQDAVQDVFTKRNESALNRNNLPMKRLSVYLMRSNAVRKQIIREGQGISRINLSPNRIRTITLDVPCLEEQQKIAGCLKTFDEAIEDLQKTVEHWKNIKKGLLQQLFAKF